MPSAATGARWATTAPPPDDGSIVGCSLSHSAAEEIGGNGSGNGSGRYRDGILRYIGGFIDIE